MFVMRRPVIERAPWLWTPPRAMLRFYGRGHRRCCCGGECDATCQVTPTNSPSVTVEGTSSLCDSAEGTYTGGTFSAGPPINWTWTHTNTIIGTDTLEIRCKDGEYGAAIVNDLTDLNWGGNDSQWAGYKDVTADVTCDPGGNLTGTFVLDDLAPCTAPPGKQATVTL